VKRFKKRLQQGLGVMISLALLGYGGLCLFLFVRQRQMIINPAARIFQQPEDYRLPAETVWLPVSQTPAPAKLHSWWIPAKPGSTQAITLIYFSGRGSNKSYNLPRMEGLWRLGVSILMIDYRGVGGSPGEHPSEASMYADAQAAWNYLTQTRKIPANQVMLYGESLGGAVALELAIRNPQAKGLILQSTFTSIADWATRQAGLRLLPIDLLLNQRFDSQAKIGALQMPVLLLHGTADPIVPAWMSQNLYNAAPQPKRLLLVPGKGHHSIYQAGPQSYLQVIAQFFGLKPTANRLD
jgi:uncharacterized protein